MPRNVTSTPPGPGSVRQIGEPALPPEAERYRIALEHAAVGVALVDLAGRPLYLNAAMARMSDADPLRGLDAGNVASVTHHDDLERTHRLIVELIEGRRERYVIEKRYVRPGGGTTPARLTVSLARDAGGQPLFAVAIAEDLREVEDLRDRLVRAARFDSLSTLARGIAHDFNNMLTSVLGSIELARSDPAAGPDIRARMDDAMAALDRIRDLTRQLQEYARGHRSQHTRFDAVALVREVARAALSGTSTRWRVNAADPMPLLDADRAQLAQVLANLLQNASQAMEGAGEVDIELAVVNRLEPPGADAPPGPHLRFVIRDRGPGIEAGMLPRIFDPYFTTRPGGTGLGLAICDSIVRGHHGRLTVASEPGHGAEFSVLVPLYPPQSAGR